MRADSEELPSVSVYVYHVAVHTFVLSRHGSNLARLVIIHDIIHSLSACQVGLLHIVDFLGSRWMKTAPMYVH